MTFLPRPPRQFGAIAVLCAWGSLALLVSGPQSAVAEPLPSPAPPSAGALEPPEPAKPAPDPAALSVRVGGLIQVEWLVHNQASLDEVDPSTQAPLNEDRILLRRGRVFAVARRGFVSGRVTFDANTQNSRVEVRPYDALVSVRWPETASDALFTPGIAGDAAQSEYRAEGVAVMASAGLMRIPFGIETSEPTAFRPWLERSTWSTAFFGAGRDFGLSVDAVYRFLEASVALMNGEPLDTGRYSGLDLNGAKDWVGRIGVNGRLFRHVYVEAGFSFVSGKGLHLGTPQTKQTQTWIDNNENGLVEVSELSVTQGIPASPSKNFSRSALGGDVRVRVDLPVVGPLTLACEVARAQNLDRALQPADPVAAGRGLRELGWSLGLSQRLTRYAEIAVRRDEYDPDFDARRPQGGIVVPADSTYTTWALAAAFHWKNARLLGEYDFRDNALGISNDGDPTRLKMNALTFRAELTF